jgi:hypothetical protein
VQHLPQRLLGEADVCQCLVKASDRALIHFLVRAVAAVDAHDGCLAAVALGVGVRSAERVGAVGGEPLAVLGVEAVAEGVAGSLPKLGPTESERKECLARA